MSMEGSKIDNDPVFSTVSKLNVSPTIYLCSSNLIMYTFIYWLKHEHEYEKGRQS